MKQAPEKVVQIAKAVLSKHTGLPEERIRILNMTESRNTRLATYIKGNDSDYYKYELGEESW